MGLFLDGSGFPLAFSLYPGNMNEQQTLLPLEKRILEDFGLSKLIVCTDAGLSSTVNRKFNDRKDRAFITTQSVKKLKSYQKEWALDPEGWCLGQGGKTYDLRHIPLEDEAEMDTFNPNRTYSMREAISALKSMTLFPLGGQGYAPSYRRTAITDDLHTLAGFRTDYEAISNQTMKTIIQMSKKS